MRNGAGGLSWWRAPFGGRREGDVLVGAASLFGTTLVTSAVGFAFWAVAARWSTQAAVGYASAAISVMTLLGTLGMVGLGTVLIAELPGHADRARLLSTAVTVSAGASAVLSVGYLVVTRWIGADAPLPDNDAGTLVLFVGGVALTGASLVLDQGSLGLGRGGLQLWRNTIFSVTKLLLLVPFARAVGDAYGVGIVQAWVGGVLVSLVIVGVASQVRGTALARRPRLSLLHGLRRVVLAHNWLNLAVQTPRLLMPLVAVTVVSAAAGGAFFAAWTVVGFLLMVPTHLSTALFAVGAADPAAAAQRCRTTLLASVTAGIPAAMLLAVAAPWLLQLFGPEYVDTATLPMRILTLAYLPFVVKSHYVAAARLTGRLSRGAALLTAGAACEIVATAWGGHVAGTTGLCVALVLAVTVEALVMAPAVWRLAATGTRRAAMTTTTSMPQPGSPEK